MWEETRSKDEDCANSQHVGKKIGGFLDVGVHDNASGGASPRLEGL